MEVKSREKEQRYIKMREKYSQSLRPASIAKLSEAQNEFDYYEKASVK